MKYLLILIFIVPFSLFAQQFSRIYGDNRNNDFAGIVALPDNEYMVCGTSENSLLGDSDIYIARIDDNGEIVWDSLYGFAGKDIASALVVNDNGNVVIAGATNSFNPNNDLDILLFEIDLEGNVLWSKSFKENNQLNEIPVRINRTPRGLVLCATRAAIGSITPDFLIVEVSYDGRVINWQNQIGVSAGDGDICKNIIPSLSGGYILVGGTYNSSTIYDQVIIRLNSQGIIQNHVRLGGNGNEDASDVIELPSGELVVMGNFRSISGSGLEIALTSIAIDNRINWIRTYGDNGNGDQRAYGFSRINDGYVISGYSTNLGAMSEDLLLFQVNSIGELMLDPFSHNMLSAFYGGVDNERSNGLIVDVVDGEENIFVLGNTTHTLTNQLGRNGVLLRASSNGNIASSCSRPLLIERSINTNSVLRTPYTYNQTNPNIMLLESPLRVQDPVFYIGQTNCQTLPVSLLSFDVSEYMDGAILRWSTANEIKSSIFEVEKSLNASDWDKLGSVNAAGYSEKSKSYSYFDNEKMLLKQYYRLKVIDIDGGYQYSKIISVKNKNNSGNRNCIEIFPVPAENELNVHFVNKRKVHCNVEVVDVLGNAFYKEDINELEDIVVDTSALTSGLYFLIVSSEELFEKVKFIKK